MRQFRHPAGLLASMLLLFTSTAIPAAEAPTDPFRLIPDQADLVVRVDRPRQLIEAYTTLDLVKQLQTLEAFREFFDSTNYRRFYQFVSYYEKQLGAGWPELLDRLAGGGAVLAVKYGTDPAPALLVVQGKDEALLKQFMKISLEMVEQELARQESKDKITRGSHRDIETVLIGKNFYAAVAGSALLMSNNAKALHLGIDLHLDGDAKSMARVAGPVEARKLLPQDPLAWMWLNLEPIRQYPQAKEVFALPRNDVNLTVLFGGWLDVAGRAPYVCAGLHRDPHGWMTSIRMPRGRDGMSALQAVLTPPEGQPGSLPLLEPRGVLVSSSYYMDLSKYWENRAKLFNDKQIKAFEEFDKNSGRFLAGSQFSKLIAQAGGHQRIVVAHQEKVSYKTQPAQRIPAFAIVVDMRQPEPFSKSMEAILRSAAFLAGTQVSLKLVEEKHGDVTIIGYRFPEDSKFKGDVNNIRFNFSPCFTAVGDQYVVSSTLELCRELVDLLHQEAKASQKKTSPATERTQLYAAGGVEVLRAIEDQLFAQTILQQALAPEEAKKQVQAFLDLIRRLGVLRFEANYGAQEFRYDIRLTLGK